MASAWGTSWGTAWGNSWGTVGAPTPPAGNTAEGGRRRYSSHTGTSNSYTREKHRALMASLRKAKKATRDEEELKVAQETIETVDSLAGVLWQMPAVGPVKVEVERLAASLGPIPEWTAALQAAEALARLIDEARAAEEARLIAVDEEEAAALLLMLN